MTESGRPMPAGALAGRRQAPSMPVAQSAGDGVALQLATQFPELTDASLWWSTGRGVPSRSTQSAASSATGPGTWRDPTHDMFWDPLRRLICLAAARDRHRDSARAQSGNEKPAG
jgi:hypothetical protein